MIVGSSQGNGIERQIGAQRELVKILLDTNIVIHREAATVVDEDIGILFRWLDNLHHIKCIHTVMAEELERHEDPKVRLSNYQ